MFAERDAGPRLAHALLRADEFRVARAHEAELPAEVREAGVGLRHHHLYGQAHSLRRSAGIKSLGNVARVGVN